ncbi:MULTISPECIES: right-handed parallel beta-helix repeat-containing protein [Halomonadaceae]|uniref:Type III secretion-associated outer membrane-bound protein HpaM n=1 Tax=Modicisalibacter zincidurans TaxID=1178777 RepID=A0ABP9R693_9GAMM|nr:MULTISPECIES: right-handed parallel beta-helix repeat-containing protein [Halomonas]MCD6007875.1 right-handed parallel beta-helix repeat-containing protein [Halomonas sp. IOP_31]
MAARFDFVHSNGLRPDDEGRIEEEFVKLLADPKRMRWLACSALVLIMALASGLVSANPEADCDRRIRPGEDLQNALDGLPRNDQQQTVCLDAGIYRLNEMVVIERDNLTLRGQASGGQKATVLQMQEGLSSPVLVLGDAYNREPQSPIRQVTVENLALRGDASTQREFKPALPYLSNSGLVVRRGEGIVLRNLDIRQCRSACLLTEYHSRDVLIENNTMSQAKWDGLSLNRAGPTRVVGNVIEDNVAAGITVEYLQGSEIVDNVIAGNGSHGLYLADAENNRFSNNLIKNNQLAGVFLTCSIRDRDPVLCWEDSFSRNNVFSNNRFENNRYGFRIAVDKAANCQERGGPPTNVSRGDVFVDSPNKEPAWEEYGRCIAYDGSRTLEPSSPQSSD